MAALQNAGARLYALSYDEPDALRDFRDAYGITYTLLSDPDSEVIRALGILNTLIDENDHPWYGIPFPGTYVMDADGVITHKFFENNLALRVGPEELRRAVTGEPFDSQHSAPGRLEDSEPPLAGTADLLPEVFLDGTHLAVGVLRHLVARFQVPSGRHLYAAVPAGPDPSASASAAATVPVSLELDPHPRLVTRPVERPESERLTSTATGETMNVHHGTVELRLPITVNGTLTSESDSNSIALSGTLRWQTCDDQVCDVPRTQRFELTVPVAGPVLSELMGTPGARGIRAMNGQAHFQRMRERHNSS
jgi:hypothetical protein